MSSNEEVENNFLEELDSDKFVVSIPLNEKNIAKQKKEEDRQMKQFILQSEREAKKLVREQKMNEKNNSKNSEKIMEKKEEENNSLFGESATPIHGRDKLILLKKVQQYKTLFPEKLSKFKIKKNPTIEDLNTALLEMEALVEVSGVDSFLLDSMLQIIKVIETTTSHTVDYNISGLSLMLKSNKEFTNLMKILFVKYGCYSAIPCEFQLILIVGTTAMICINKNKNRSSINNYLDEPLI